VFSIVSLHAWLACSLTPCTLAVQAGSGTQLYIAVYSGTLASARGLWHTHVCQVLVHPLTPTETAVLCFVQDYGLGAGLFFLGRQQQQQQL
jgi:hypothetical protein